METMMAWPASHYHSRQALTLNIEQEGGTAFNPSEYYL